MQNEIWVPVKNFPNYEVSNLGEVRRILNQKTRKPVISDRGYAVLNLYSLENKKWKMKKLSRIVWESFNDCSCPEVIDHMDEDKLNNNISNLRCITHHQNIKGRSSGFHKKLNKYNLTDEIKKLIISNYRNKVWSAKDIQERYGIHSNYFFSVVGRGTWDKLLNE